MSANVKANIKQQEIKDLVAVSYIFFKKYPQNLKYSVKEGVFFIWFSWRSSSIHLDIVSVNNRDGGGGGWCFA